MGEEKIFTTGFVWCRDLEKVWGWNQRVVWKNICREIFFFFSKPLEYTSSVKCLILCMEKWKITWEGVTFIFSTRRTHACSTMRRKQQQLIMFSCRFSSLLSKYCYVLIRVQVVLLMDSRNYFLYYNCGLFGKKGQRAWLFVCLVYLDLFGLWIHLTDIIFKIEDPNIELTKLRSWSSGDQQDEGISFSFYDCQWILWSLEKGVCILHQLVQVGKSVKC